MPMYDYTCRKCDYVLRDIFAPFNHRQEVCPVCGEVADRKFPLTASRRDMTVQGESK